MQTAADALNFEQAAQLRDLLADLRRTTRKTRVFSRLPQSLPAGIDPAADLRELAGALALPAPPKAIEGFDISNISGTFAVASLVRFVGGRPDRAGYRRFRIKTVTGQDDFACLAEAVRRRYSRLLKEGAAARSAGAAGKRPGLGQQRVPDLILIDGGKGQLSAAWAELQKLGLATIPVIGLAKAFEEIYRPGEKGALRLATDSGALKLLQRVRDESHRFANTYSAQLRLKRISESLLDEFPGLGERRKAALLKRFGSVHRLRTASIKEIAEVPGFGGKTAAQLRAFLAARTVTASGASTPGHPIDPAAETSALPE